MVTIYYSFSEKKETTEFIELLKFYDAKLFVEVESGSSRYVYKGISSNGLVVIKGITWNDENIDKELEKLNPIKVGENGIIDNSVINHNIEELKRFFSSAISRAVNNLHTCEHCKRTMLLDDGKQFCPFCGVAVKNNSVDLPIKACRDCSVEPSAYLPMYNNCPKCGKELTLVEGVNWYDFNLLTYEHFEEGFPLDMMDIPKEKKKRKSKNETKSSWNLKC